MRNKKLTVSLQEAQEIICGAVVPLGGECLDIMAAANRILHQDIVSGVMVPPLACAARDGYAIIASETRGASRISPRRLRIVGETQAGGSSAGKRVWPGAALRIMTGAPLLVGTDAVVQFEDTEEEDGYVRVFRETAEHENYRNAGENIRTGECVLRRGDRLNSAALGVLASLNYDKVRVYRRPRVSIISTGDELAGLGGEIEPGKIRDVNAYALYAEVKKCNALPDYLGIARDSLAEVREMFSRALNYDVAISTGGVSMGKYDFVKDIYADLRIEMLFEGVNVKPGKPCAFGRKGDKLFFGLPGNPVSALTSFIQFVRPALLRLMGARRILKPVVNAVLAEDINKKKSGNTHLLRGRFTIKDNEFHVATTGSQKSSIFQSMIHANCLIVVPEDATMLRAGQKVAIQLIDHDEI